jgi:hypothetical protein
MFEYERNKTELNKTKLKEASTGPEGENSDNNYKDAESINKLRQMVIHTLENKQKRLKTSL